MLLSYMVFPCPFFPPAPPKRFVNLHGMLEGFALVVVSPLFCSPSLLAVTVLGQLLKLLGSICAQNSRTSASKGCLTAEEGLGSLFMTPTPANIRMC